MAARHASFTRRSRRTLTLAALVLLAGTGNPTSAQDTGFFGPEKAFELQPEVDAYCELGEPLRLQMQVQSAIVPSAGNATINVGAFVDWIVAPYLRDLLSPDRSKTHALTLSLGARYSGTLAPGTTGSSQYFELQGDFIPRYFLPWSVLLTNRNRVQTRWDLGSGDSFTFRYLGRLQVEREFAAGHVGITPFIDAEFHWQAPPAMWNELWLEAGVDCSFGGLGRGQVVEVKYSTVTYLQPSRSWRPVVSFVWYVFF